jgi:hypothetical protein
MPRAIYHVVADRGPYQELTYFRSLADARTWQRQYGGQIVAAYNTGPGWAPVPHPQRRKIATAAPTTARHNRTAAAPTDPTPDPKGPTLKDRP